MKKIKRKLLKLRLQPIRVLCFHQVSDVFDENSMYQPDWLQTDEFKGLINSFRNAGYTFISLTDAHDILKHDCFRRRKYAVLTADDGWASWKNILPWLDEQHIPITLFLNPASFDGTYFRIKETEQYLSQQDVEQLTRYPLVTIGSHGWAHLSAIHISEQEFTDNVEKGMAALSQYPNYIPYFAYTWGWHSDASDAILINHNLIPVYVSGNKNINNTIAIDREILTSDSKT